ncbi:rcc1 and btb domain-containing protein 1 [Lasius niger]|uniref:Rcc1 and btb domain-containing protein 1 n=1 Tax=Lasius niger TaxID=67767 RepID=A0A0J7N5I7_LASNI|nr:rcc1 and btb domain-containing protein 1 [Lasius niger]
MVMVYGNCGNRALFVTKDKDVYTLDYNRDDYLKSGYTYIGLYPKKVEELCGKNIKTFACNLYFVVALTEEGEVYSWGFKKKDKSDDESHTLVIASTPTRVAGSLSGKFVVDIACGSDHSLALTRDGKVYAWGENKYGQIGNGTGTYGDNRPRQVRYELEGKKIVHIACGSMFNMVLTDEGKLYGWGSNQRGQISTSLITSFTVSSLPASSFTAPSLTSFFSTSKSTSVTNLLPAQSDSKITSSNGELPKYCAYPRKITAVSGKAIVKVACGFKHTLVLTDKGKIYAWGKNDNGQLGVNDELKSSTPVMVNLLEMEKMLDIAACGNLSVAVSSDKTVYVWGDCFGEIITTPFPTGFSTIHDAFAYTTTSVMHEPLTVSMNNNVEKVLNILEFLGALFDDPSTSDFTIQVEGQPIHVHKTVLKIRCQYFKNKFQHDWTENGESSLPPPLIHIVSDKFSYIVYKAFLKYLYTGTVDLPSKKVLELMKLADEYCETNLKEECDYIIKQAITMSNVAFFYYKAIECNAKELEEFCFQFALCHMTDVILSEEYIKLDTSLKNNFILRAAQENMFKT